MNKRNLKHAFKKAWEDLKIFWAKIFDKIKRVPKKEVTKKSKFLRLILSLLSLTLIFAISHKNCNTVLDNQGAVLTVNAEEETESAEEETESAEEETDLGYFTNYTDLETHFSENYYVYRKTVSMPYTTSYSYTLPDDNTYVITYTPIEVPNIEIIYLIEKEARDLVSAQSCVCAFGIPSIAYNGGLKRLANTITYYPLPNTLTSEYNYSYSWLHNLKLPCMVKHNSSNEGFGYVEIPLNIFFERNYERVWLENTDTNSPYELGIKAYLFDSYTASLAPFSTNGNRFNLISTVFNSKYNLANPFRMGFIMSSNENVDYSSVGYIDNYNRTFTQETLGDTNFTFVKCYDFTSFNLSIDGLETAGSFDFTVSPYTSLPFYYTVNDFNYAYDFTTTQYTPTNADVLSYFEGAHYGYTEGYDTGYDAGYHQGYGDGIDSMGGEPEYNRGFVEGANWKWEQVITYNKPIWEQEATEAEYNRVVSELKPVWEQEARTAERNYIETYDKPIWEDEAYRRGLADGVDSVPGGGGSGNLTYDEGYRAGLKYANDNYKPIWTREATEAEYNRVVTELKPVWQQEARTAERNYIETNDKPIWEQEAYNRGLEASGIEFNPLNGLSKTVSTLLGTPLVTNDDGHTAVSIGTLFQVGIGVLLFGVLIKVFLGG